MSEGATVNPVTGKPYSSVCPVVAAATAKADKSKRVRKPRAASQVAYIGKWIDYMPGQEAEHHRAFEVYAGPLKNQAEIEKACEELADGEYRLLPGVNAERPIVKRTESKSVVVVGKPE